MHESFADGRFEVVRLLGKGGMGVVYEVRDAELDTTVALKTLPEAEGQLLLRFKNEFRALQDLHHPNLVSLGELMEHDGTWFFTMELIRGVDFRTYVCGEERSRAAEQPTVSVPSSHSQVSEDSPVLAKSRTAHHEPRLRESLAQLLRGLAVLHDAGKVHRDVKPGNVLVTSDGRVVLLDFGLIAERDKHDIGASHDVVGTSAYMAPEQAAGHPAQPASDFYAVGVMLYEVLTGRLPFGGKAYDVLRRKQVEVPVHPAELVAGIAPDLADLCANLLRLDPNERPTSEALRRAFHAGGSWAPARADVSSRFGSEVIGREPELARLGDAFDATLAGNAITVLVYGESGVGKTTLIGEFARQRSETTDVVVLRGRCFERESVPFKGFDRVVDALAHLLETLPTAEVKELVPANAGVLLQAFPVLSRVNAIALSKPTPSAGDPVALRAQLFAALRDLLRALAKRHAVIVTIDDMQWADADSKILLRALLAAPDAPPLLVLLSAREHVDLFRNETEGLREIELGPLDSSDAAELARTLLKQIDAEETSDANTIAREAAGHPLYIAELAQLAAVPGGPGGALRLRDAILWRASKLGLDTQRLLQLVTVSAGPLPLSAVRQALDVDAASFTSHIGTLRVSNLIRCSSGSAPTVEPYHDHVREGVVSALSAETARLHHERLAAALVAHEARVQPELLLHHLEAAGQVVQAAKYADEAARRAADVFAFVRAAELLRVAIRLGGYRGDELRARQRRLADALLHAGRGALSAEQYLLAARGADPTSSLECTGLASRSFISTGHLDRGIDTMHAVLDSLGIKLPRSQNVAAASILWHRAKLTLRGRRWRVRGESEIPKHDLAMVDTLRVLAEAWGPVSPVHANLLHQRCLAMALRLGESKRITRALGLDATFMASQGPSQLARARLLVDDAKRYAVAAGSDDYFLMDGPMDGVLSFFAGEFEQSAQQLGAAEETCLQAEVFHPTEVNTIRLFWLGALRELGAFARWRDLLPEFLQDAERRGDLLAYTSIRRVSVIVRLADGDPEGARADLASTSWRAPADHFHLQDWMELQARVEIALYERMIPAVSEWALAQFRRLRRSLLYYSTSLRCAANSLWARLLLALALDSERHPHALRDAGRLAEKMRSDWGSHVGVWATLIEAGVATQEGDDATALRRLKQVERDGGALGLAYHVAAARLRRAGLMGGAAGEALRAQTASWQEREGVVDLPRLVEVVAPGFDASSVPNRF